MPVPPKPQKQASMNDMPSVPCTSKETTPIPCMMARRHADAALILEGLDSPPRKTTPRKNQSRAPTLHSKPSSKRPASSDNDCHENGRTPRKRLRRKDSTVVSEQIPKEQLPSGGNFTASRSTRSTLHPLPSHQKRKTPKKTSTEPNGK
uniref:Serine/arginine repetitive matrix protein 2-like n=1 Tax=Caenorhabditis tropicalis TaxID=1561998 RepID=A0A1I7UF13_9PELO